eukprot:TRINITY_DN11885_c0_g1_i1.p1 TRINITY_DN11885_c0_g1~~TRINITY_DN11885_c0_g1_i1.p1  ORF type:complete len:253 (-),score=39.12 TRINITY_DN11885_c0_g1_i1:382-1140(-)
MQCLTALLFALLPRAALGAEEQSADRALALSNALQQEDECSTFGEAPGDCALSALQLKSDSEVIPKIKVWTLYHATSPEIGPNILKEGFRPGRIGWCGGGIYFANTIEATSHKAIGVDSHQGFIIEANVSVGDVVFKPWYCLADLQCLRSASSRHGGCQSTRTAEDIGNDLRSQGHDTIVFNPGDGNEIVIYNSSQVLSMRHVPWPSQNASLDVDAQIEAAKETEATNLTDSDTPEMGLEGSEEPVAAPTSP